MYSKIVVVSLSVLFALNSLSLLFFPTVAKADQAINLLPNSSFETPSATDNSRPASWSSDNWGSNAATFTYTSDARTGTKALQTTLANYQNGDGKWVTSSIAVSGEETYQYSDWYKSTSTTYLWAQFTTIDGSYQYAYLKQLGASTATWTQGVVTITIPSNTIRINVFHVISESGQLTIDDTSLSKLTICNYTSVNGLANGTFEEACPSNTTSAPLGWQAMQYGSALATFNKTSVNAHSGLYAAQLTNNAGEAGYMTIIDHPSSNQRYTIAFWHNSTTYLYAYVAFQLKTGAVQYQGLMSAPATLGEWSLYEDSFVTPTNIQSMQIVLATSGSGSISIDDVTLTTRVNQEPSTFTKGMVSLTFDDGTRSIYNNAVPLLKRYNYKGTFYINGGSLNTVGYMTSAQIKALATDNQELGSHLYEHSDIVSLNTTSLEGLLSSNSTTLKSILGSSYSINSFASPYGSYTSGKVDTIMKYASSHRNTDGVFNTKTNLNVKQIHARLVTASTSAATVQAWVQEATSTRSWLVLVYHNIAASTIGQSSDVALYNVTPTNFKKHLDAIKTSGVDVSTVSGAIQTLNTQ